jgi:hypothetical protein
LPCHIGHGWLGRVGAAGRKADREHQDGGLLSKFFRENVLQAQSQFIQNRLQLVESDVVLAAFDAVEGGVRNPDLLGKIRIRQAPPRLPQEFRKLAIQVSLHREKLSK